DGPVSGKTVLVAGGAGAGGHFAIQLARWAGAQVITTVSGPEQAQPPRQAGAEPAVNYRDPHAETQTTAVAEREDPVPAAGRGAPAVKLSLRSAIMWHVRERPGSGRGDEADPHIRLAPGADPAR